MTWKNVLGYRPGNTRETVKKKFAKQIRQVHEDKLMQFGKAQSEGHSNRAKQLLAAWAEAQEYFREAPRQQPRPRPRQEPRPRETPRQAPPPSTWYWYSPPEPSSFATPMDWEPTPPPAPVYRRGLTAQRRPAPKVQTAPLKPPRSRERYNPVTETFERRGLRPRRR